MSASGSAGPGFDPSRVAKIFNLGARRGGDVHFLIAVYMLRRYIVLLIAIRPSDGDVKPGGPLGAFREEQAPGFTFSLPFIIIIVPHNTITLHILFRHVMWSAQAVRDSKIDHT